MDKKRILIIDDEIRFSKLLKINLEQAGTYDVRTENHGSLGLSTAKEFKPSLILLDLMMPDADGAELARKLAEDPQTRNIPVVFLTALATKSETRGGGAVIGGKPFISKTASVEELLKVIEKYAA